VEFLQGKNVPKLLSNILINVLKIFNGDVAQEMKNCTLGMMQTIAVWCDHHCSGKTDNNVVCW